MLSILLEDLVLRIFAKAGDLVIPENAERKEEYLL